MPESPKMQILRVGVIQGGKIIEEKLIRKRGPITVGSGTRNTLVLPAANVPKSFSLFELRGNDYYLSFTEQMSGRISVGEQATDLQSLKAQNLVRKTGATYSLKVSEGSKGRISVGEFIVLFQFIEPPPEPVRPQLPSVVRGYWMHNIDWPYSSTFGGLMIFFFAIVVWAHNVPLPKEMGIDDIPDRFAKMVMPDKIKEEKTTDDNGAGKKEEEQPKQKKNEPKKEEQPVEDDGGNEEVKAAKAAIHRAEVEKKVSGRGLLKLLGAKGPGGMAAGGAVADVFAEGSIDGSGDGVFEGIGGVDIATAAGQQGQRGVAGAGTAASIEDLGTKGVVGGVGDGSGKQKVEARVLAKVTAANLQEFDSDSRNQKDIMDVLRRRMGGIKSCYEKRLKRNPELKGKVVVRFVIHAGGAVMEAEVLENTTGDAELASCISDRIKSIRFPQAEGAETTVTYPIILVPGNG
jgi:outer membrane biosynthesis protein TonB